MSQTHTFEHKAMKTIFTLRLQHPEKKHAQHAAHSAFDLIDEVENKLSRYREGSDVWQINHMEAGQTLFLSDMCYDCLRLSLEAYGKTLGLFDVTLGRQIEHQKRKSEGEPPDISGQLAMVPNRPAIHCNEPGREIDLGGVGKGFALDSVKQRLLEDSGIESGILSAGASTHLAFGAHRWVIGLSARNETKEIAIEGEALSASGTGVQNEHILSPDGIEESYRHPRAWVVHHSAAWADIWSTTAMIMPGRELKEQSGEFTALFVEDAESGKVHAIKSGGKI
ncbi:MAG TPA: FAD:protein FMN transferase [Opitutales bacterium]|nr:FAD:protein FMN transferase [Opitutales bacterium]